jgi:hypothetical protein
MLLVNRLREWIGYVFRPRRRRSLRRRQNDPLDHVLWQWTRADPFCVRDLLTSICILGVSGSGKTSSSGKFAGRKIIQKRAEGMPSTGGLIICGTQSDVALWTKIFEAAGRKEDLLCFSPEHKLRFNFLDYLQKLGGDCQDIVNCIRVLGETLQSQGRGDSNQDEFWAQAQERLLFYAVLVVKIATGGHVTASDLQRFISGAATSVDQLKDPIWAESLHAKYLEAAHQAIKSEADAHDFQLAAEYWLQEYVALADRTRSSIVTGVMGTLHVFSTGIARTMISGTTNVSPADIINEGKWIIVNMTTAEYGVAGAFICAGWKYLTQRTVLRRIISGDSRPVGIWADEAHLVINSFDATYLAQCRSRLGFMVYLSQGLPGFYAAMKGESGKHEVDSLLGNFGHWILHTSDPITAEAASKKLGKQRESFFGGSSAPAADVFDELFGPSRMTGSFNEHYEPVLQERVLLGDLRNGGPRNKNLCDAVVIRSGRPFASGSNWLLTSFSQE